MLCCLYVSVMLSLGLCNWWWWCLVFPCKWPPVDRGTPHLDLPLIFFANFFCPLKNCTTLLNLEFTFWSERCWWKLLTSFANMYVIEEKLDIPKVDVKHLRKAQMNGKIRFNRVFQASWNFALKCLHLCPPSTLYRGLGTCIFWGTPLLVLTN